MSWLSSIPNPFKSLTSGEQPPEDGGTHVGDGVKDELTAIGESISRQLRVAAAFLAPEREEEEGEGEGALAGIRSDLAEIGGTFKESISVFSSKVAAGFLQLGDDDDHGGDFSRKGEEEEVVEEEEEEGVGVGISEEVVEFARRVSGRDELWIDFPMSLPHEFDMSDAQSEHASVIEQLVPSLVDLRSRLSSVKSESVFWMVYFILLLPRLNDDDLELLSTPEIVEARETLLLMLKSKKDAEIDTENPQTDSSSVLDNQVHAAEQDESQSVGKVVTPENLDALRSLESNEFGNTEKLIDKEDVIIVASDDNKQTVPKADESEMSRTLSNEEAGVADDSHVRLVTKEHENVDHWEQKEEEEEPVTTGTSAAALKRFQSDDDVSFSDLEDDDNDLPGRPSVSGQSHPTRTSSPEESSDWVRLNTHVVAAENLARGQSSLRGRDSEGEESTDWLTVDDFDP